MEEQNTNSTDVCVKCGTPLGDGQDFCPKCGTPKGGPEKKFCGKCGAELADGQEYCPKCGQKIGLANDEHVSSSTDKLNAGSGEKKKKNNIKIILAIAIPVVLIAVGLLVFSLLSGSVKGKYVLVSSNSSAYYNFEDGKYIYNSGDDTEQGTYKVEKDKVTLSVSGKDDTFFYRVGKYLINRDTHFDQKIQDGKTFNQTFTHSISATYQGHIIAIASELTLKSDGTYTYPTYMTYDGALFGDDFKTDSGTYERSGNKLILSPKGKNYTETLIIKDGIVYYAVYMKEK